MTSVKTLQRRRADGGLAVARRAVEQDGAAGVEGRARSARSWLSSKVRSLDRPLRMRSNVMISLVSFCMLTDS